MKLLCRCPHCNGLFEAVDYSQTGVICRWCGNDVGVAEYVEANLDEKKILEDMLANQMLKGTELGLFYTTWWIMGPTIVALIPVIIVCYKLFSGLSVAWYLWVLGAMAAIFLLSLPSLIKKERKVIGYIKNLAAQHNYSFETLKNEIPSLKAKSKQIEDSDSSEAELLSDVADELSKIIPYAYSKISVQSHYAKGDSRGVILSSPSAGEQQTNAAAGCDALQTERVVYIVPPHNCPACNYAYKIREMDDSTVKCPHCSLEIDVIDKSVRTKTQAMIREFFISDKKMQADSTNKMFMWFGIVMLAIAVIVMLSQGIERFFFSLSFLLLFAGCSFIVIYLSSTANQRNLKKKVKNGSKDLFEIEMFVRSYLSVEMGDDFYKLKEEIVRSLKK